MKPALIITEYNKGPANIGDYIQAAAASIFTGNNELYLERERLNEYHGEPVKAIFNGWFFA
jgi:hypothetical protein